MRRLISTGSPFEAEIGYSRAVVSGNQCFISGVTGYDYATMTLPEDVRVQTSNCLDTIEQVLTEAGFGMRDLVRMHYIIPSRTNVPLITPILGARLGGIRPAATMIIAELMESEMKIEIEATAMKDT
ncbi:MAG: RidA family protein [Pseudomonadota bacterium]